MSVEAWAYVDPKGGVEINTITGKQGSTMALAITHLTGALVNPAGAKPYDLRQVFDGCRPMGGVIQRVKITVENEK